MGESLQVLDVAVVLLQAVLIGFLVCGAYLAELGTASFRSIARALVLSAAMLPALGHGQEAFPVRPVKFIVPFPAGSPPDVLARIAAQKLAMAWGSPVIVEVRDGAGGIIGVNEVVKAAPDGYTLLFTPDLPIVIAPAVSKLPYDPARDIAPIGAVAKGSSVLVAHPSARIGSVKELIAAAKSRPGQLTYASAGDASASRMCMGLIEQSAGIELMQVPYRGAAPAVQAVLTGEVSMFCSPMFQALSNVKSGKLVAVGVTSATPSPLLPDVTPISAQGVAGASIYTWYGAFAPSSTASLLLDKISTALKKAFDGADVREKLSNVGLDSIWMSQGELAAAIRSDLGKWTHVAKAAGIKAE